MSRKLIGAVSLTALLCLSVPAIAATGSQSEMEALQAKNQQLESKVEQLEARLNAFINNTAAPASVAAAPPPSNLRKLESRVTELEQQQVANVPAAAPESGQSTSVQSNDNAFNPAISAVLSGHYGAFASDDPSIKGFGLGGEGGRAANGLALDEAEIGLSANVDDKFAAAVIASLSEEGGETEVELEEAYVRSLGLPGGVALKLGRSLEPVGYINEHHAHTDDFADRSLPNRAFLNGSYKDDGALASWILPTDTYTEVGAGAFRGSDFPASANPGDGIGAWLGYARMGGDIGQNQNWLLGLSTLQTRPRSRMANEDNVIFNGNSDLYAASLRYIWAPTGNSELQELTLQGEYFWRHEDGTYEDVAALTGAIPYDGNQSGWYAQGVYKFAPQWRIGTRFSMLSADNVPAALAGTDLDSQGHDPWNASLMGDWTNSEFSRVRLQYTHEEPSNAEKDDQFILQYIMSIGAHPAHIF